MRVSSDPALVCDKCGRLVRRSFTWLHGLIGCPGIPRFSESGGSVSAAAAAEPSKTRGSEGAADVEPPVLNKSGGPFCGKCSAGYVYPPGDNFVGQRCSCNPAPEE